MSAHMRIDCIPQSIKPPDAGEIKMSHLPAGMHTCVCAPCPIHHDLLSTRRQDRAFQHRLNGKAIGLALPAYKACAIIFNNDFITRH